MGKKRPGQIGQVKNRLGKYTTNLSSVMFGTVSPKPKMMSVGMTGVASSAKHEAAVVFASCWYGKQTLRKVCYFKKINLVAYYLSVKGSYICVDVGGWAGRIASTCAFYE